ncbi:hypothetical protein [Methanobacterium oryzae]|uniref:hypothetical protein n=1 Tax=Methanobacterium oryzae TaxID=69540 RepID=UPI003D19AE82
MQKYYLICKNCNGYYQLEEGESPDNFDVCQCGGDLIPTTDIYEYYGNIHYEDDVEYEPEYETRKSSVSKTSLIILLLTVAFSLLALINIIDPQLTSDNQIPTHQILGSDYRGYVTKDIYTNSLLEGKSKTIVIVTGMHPREKVSKSVASDIAKKNYLYSNLEFVHYDITVTDNPDNYKLGRNNGEGLAADYILPDILKSNNDLVIICHDHKPGYGQGFYIATPEMDEESVKLAQSVDQTLVEFNYFKADSTKERSTSATKFSKPLAAAGYKTFVYEIPEWTSYREAYNMTSKLINACSNFLI